MKNFFFRFNLSSSPHYSSIHYAFFDLSFETKIMVAVRQREREREREEKREGLLMVGLRGVLQKLESSKAPARLESAAERNDRAYE